MSKRVEFLLSMPGARSWNGRWSGEGRNWSIVKTLSDAAAVRLLGERSEASWSHRWDDGWCALVSARVVRGRLPKSDGFSGYDWMVANILDHGDTREAAPAWLS